MKYLYDVLNDYSLEVSTESKPSNYNWIDKKIHTGDIVQLGYKQGELHYLMSDNKNLVGEIL